MNSIQRGWPARRQILSACVALVLGFGSISGQANALVNGNFEADPFDSGWSISTGVLQHPGLTGGSTKAALMNNVSTIDLVQCLPNTTKYNNPPAGTRGQFSSTGPIWRLNFNFAVAPSTASANDRSLNMLVAHDAAPSGSLPPQINFRITSDGRVQAYRGGPGIAGSDWVTIFPAGTVQASESNGSELLNPTVYFLQIDGDYSTYSPFYTVSLRPAASAEFTHVAKVTAWQYSPPKPGDGVIRVRYHGAVQIPYVVDNVSLESLRAPYTAAELDSALMVMDLKSFLGVGNSTFNPRTVDGTNYVLQINSPLGFGVYRSGTDSPSFFVDNTGLPLEHRMVIPFRGPNRMYLLASSSGATLNALFSRYNLETYERVDTAAPDNQTVEGFDWVDDDTIICTSYTSGNRRRLYLATVVAEPFTISLNTRWNANGYITSAATTRIRNVRTGGLYTGYAYYGDNGQNSNPNFFALNLQTGQETLLGNAGTLTGGGSFGVWTVLERNGYLYVQTTDNGIRVYSMNGPTSLGALYATYSKAQLDAITGNPGQYFGLDVNLDGTKLLLGGLEGRVVEIGKALPLPALSITRAQENVLLSWPATAGSFTLETIGDLNGETWSDSPYAVENAYEVHRVTVPVAMPNEYFRLRKN